MARVAVILSGCGVHDGSEIHEAVITLLCLDRQGVAYECLAPNKPQAGVVNHLTGKPATQTRNVLEESARIARGKAKDIAEANPADYAAVILPGGFGASKNLCDYAAAGAKCEVDPAVRRFLVGMHNQGKPIGGICISPVILARALGANGSPKLTIGNDPKTANHIEEMGAEHLSCPVDDIVVDAENKIVTTPAYMLADGISEVERGIDKLVIEVLRLAKGSGSRVRRTPHVEASSA
jgi:enhancing lycopene biosynthesis protein 2